MTLSLSVEIAANLLNAVSILLAGRNNVHTWWSGIVACLAFAWLFHATQLYADMALQFFFIGSGVLGYWQWRGGKQRIELPIRRSTPVLIATLGALGLLVTLAYAALLHWFTDAYAPLPDSAVLAFSVLGQFLLIGRRVESWWCWLLVNTVSVPLYFSRELYLTAVLYCGFWVNALVSLRHWYREAKSLSMAPAPGAP